MAAMISSMISVRLMMVVEKAQVIVAGAIGQRLQTDRIVAMAIGTHKLFMIKIGIAIFSRISYLIFSLEGMYEEKAVQKAIATMMSTVVASTKARAAAKRTGHIARNVKGKLLMSKADT
ncbi:MAG TPA: hypothetical protein VGA14_00045 [Nitrososphaera sp.]